MEITIQLPDSVDRVTVYGPAERNLKMIRESLGVNIAARDGRLSLAGDASAVTAARDVMDSLIEAARRGRSPDRQEVIDAIAEAGWRSRDASQSGPSSPASLDDLPDRLDVYAAGRPIAPKTPNQRAYLEAIRDNDLVIGIGPAGTGKTYLAVAAAIHMLKVGRVKRAILARPAVEAGERLGFLPGDQFAKVNPYLRPLLDALHDMMDYPTIKRFMASDIIEVVPLAFMRGRTLNDSIIILDEAQNTTRGQMQMFLTRMGQRSRMIVTGDTTQIDLEDPRDSGLIDAARRLRRTPGVAFCTLEKSDVIRHELVQRIIEAYTDEAPGEAPTGGIDSKPGAVRADPRVRRGPATGRRAATESADA